MGKQKQDNLVLTVDKRENTMSPIIWRNIGSYTHFLNCINGEIISIEANSVETKRILDSPANYEFDHDAKIVFYNTKGQYNSRLCRKNLIKLGLRFNFPTMVNIELSRRCSLRCVHCYVGDKNLSSSKPSFLEQLSECDVNGLFDELKSLGVFLVVITGGEPFISKSFKTFLEIGAQKGFLMEIFSNLQYLPDWFCSSRYKDFRIGRIQTSVYSSEKKIHDSVTKSIGSFEQNIKNLYFLKEKGYFLEVATPLMRKNFFSWENTSFFFRKIGIVQNFSWPLAYEYYGLNKRRKGELNISGQNFRDFVGKNPDFLLKINNANPDEYICEAGKAIFAISATGDIFPCSQLPLSVGNIKRNKIKEIIRGKRMVKIASLKWKDIRAKKVFNFCLGINYTDAGNVLTQPEYMLNAINVVFAKKERR